MANELKSPANDKHEQRPAPVEKEQRQRNYNHRYADAVRQLIERMLMLSFVIFDE